MSFKYPYQQDSHDFGEINSNPEQLDNMKITAEQAREMANSGISSEAEKILADAYKKIRLTASAQKKHCVNYYYHAPPHQDVIAQVIKELEKNGFRVKNNYFYNQRENKSSYWLYILW